MATKNNGQLGLVVILIWKRSAWRVDRPGAQATQQFKDAQKALNHNLDAGTLEGSFRWPQLIHQYVIASINGVASATKINVGNVFIANAQRAVITVTRASTACVVVATITLAIVATLAVIRAIWAVAITVVRGMVPRVLDGCRAVLVVLLMILAATAKRKAGRQR